MRLGFLGWDYEEFVSYRDRLQQSRPRVWQVMNRAKACWAKDLILIVCNDQTAEKAHVFAAMGGFFVDIPTRGQVKAFVVDSGYVSHRVDYVLRVTKSAPKPVVARAGKKATKKQAANRK